MQELLLEEAAKLADAAVRDSLASAGTLGPVSALRDALRAPKYLAQQTVLKLPLPGPLKAGLDAALLPATVLDEMSRLVPSLAQRNQRDEETLAAFGKLWDEVSPRIVGRQEGDGGDGAAAGGGAAASDFELPQTFASVQESAGPLLEQLSDPESRLRHRLPLIGNLSRRFGATLLRRVAHRLEEDASQPDAPGIARTLAERAAAADRTLAELIEPDAPTSVAERPEDAANR